MTSSETPHDLPQTRLTVFAFMWSAAIIFHQADVGWNSGPFGAALTIVAIASLWRPEKLSLFLLVCGIAAANLSYQLPHTSNHAILMLIIRGFRLSVPLLPWGLILIIGIYVGAQVYEALGGTGILGLGVEPFNLVFVLEPLMYLYVVERVSNTDQSAE